MKKNKPGLEDVTLMLDSIFDTLGNMTPQDIESHLSSKPRDVKIIGKYIEKAEESGYSPVRLEFLKAVRDTYLK